jgi:hypothetical protein
LAVDPVGFKGHARRTYLVEALPDEADKAAVQFVFFKLDLSRGVR